MAVDDFRPEVWAAEILVALRSTLRYAQAGIINRNYEGSIAQAGDTVRITSITDPSVRSYTEHGTITWDQLADTQQSLVVDQADYFAFKVDDIERRQALSGFVEEAARGAAYNLAAETDEYVSGIMVTAVDGGANDLGAVTADISDNTAYANVFVALREKLAKANIPADGRFVIIPPELTSAILQDARFINASASGSTDELRNGQIGRIAGFNVIESNTVPTVTAGVYRVIAGHPIATTFAEQISKTEAIRIQDGFADGVKGLHVYGGKVVRPTALALADVTIQA